MASNVAALVTARPACQGHRNYSCSPATSPRCSFAVDSVARLRTSLRSPSRRGSAAIAPVRLQPAAAMIGGQYDLSSQNPSSNGVAKRPPIPPLTGEQVIRRMRSSVTDYARENYLAFFSSDIGGITQEPAFMRVPMDDHMVHRGHGVFDTCILIDGYLYQLDAHIDRLLDSAEKAGIPEFWKRKIITNIIHDTAAASGVQNGFLRFWMTAGKGGYGLGSAECDRPGFYCIATTPPKATLYTEDQEELGYPSWEVKTTPVEIKAPSMATIKSNNYLPNALAQDDAEADPYATHGIFVDQDGNVSEGGTFNVGFITHDDELVVPTFDNSLAGTTIQRIMELIPKTEKLKHLKVSQRKISVTEAKQCKEMFAAGSTTLATPILSWDKTTFSNSDIGEYTRMIRRMLWEDMQPKPPHELHTEVDYGIMTYMQ